MEHSNLVSMILCPRNLARPIISPSHGHANPEIMLKEYHVDLKKRVNGDPLHKYNFKTFLLKHQKELGMENYGTFLNLEESEALRVFGDVRDIMNSDKRFRDY